MPWIIFPKRWIDEQGAESICEATVYVTGATSGPLLDQWNSGSAAHGPLASELRQEDSRRDASEDDQDRTRATKAALNPALPPSCCVTTVKSFLER